ncbi:MAG: hypothetical protein QXO70_01630 [Candidatus Pacearchaeota archaeon]
MKKDRETENIIMEQEALSRLSKSEAWAVLKEKLNEKIKKIDSIYFLPDNVEEWEIKARKGAIEILKEIISEIETSSNCYKINEQAFVDNTEDDFIKRG